MGGKGLGPGTGAAAAAAGSVLPADGRSIQNAATAMTSTATPPSAHAFFFIESS